MASFDVRDGDMTVSELRFSDRSNADYMPDIMSKNPLSSGGIRITDSDSSRYMVIRDREHADNLIKAINKARELGWI